MFSDTRNLLAVLVKDWARYRSALNGESPSYLKLCNRYEQLEAAPDGRGYRCDWQWTSDLHAPKFLPTLGLQLMKRALADHPIHRATRLDQVTQRPAMSFIIGHRGVDRLPHLIATLESIAGQREISFECVVVEQSVDPQVRDKLPSWIRYIHTPLPSATAPFCRAWAFNVGARASRGEVLVLHDNDMLVPSDYAKEVFGRFREGYEVINLKRFIFYLSETHSAAVFGGKCSIEEQPPEFVVQNLEAGGSIAITRKAYHEIGGMDESFVGWGGEDNEFWDRAQTKHVWPYGYLPIIHFWHNAQPEKLERNRSTASLLEAKSAIPPERRIAELLARDFGNSHIPICHESRSEHSTPS